MKAFADDKFNASVMIMSLFERVQNTVGKGENACYQHFLLFSKCFSKASFLRVIKSRKCVVKSLSVREFLCIVMFLYYIPSSKSWNFPV